MDMTSAIENRSKINAELSQRIIAGNYSVEEAQKILESIYVEAPLMQKSFGETVEEIMTELGITKMWGGRKILDVAKAEELTGLDRNIFRRTMYKRDCTVDMSLVISMCIGFQLSSQFTGWLLSTAGLHFRLDNPDHLAYIFLLEYCKGYDIKTCNEILEQLGVKPSKWLGSRRRGENGEEGEYKPRKN